MDAIYVNRYLPGSGWGTPQMASAADGGRIGGIQSMAFDSYGDATIVWSASDGTRYTLWRNLNRIGCSVLLMFRRLSRLYAYRPNSHCKISTYNSLARHKGPARESAGAICATGGEGEDAFVRRDAQCVDDQRFCVWNAERIMKSDVA